MPHRGRGRQYTRARGSQTISTRFLLPTGCFLIRNQADELTLWIPLLATRFCASGYLSIPCCAWSFDARFDRMWDVPLCAVDSETLNLGGGGGGEEGNSPSSSYALYRVWRASLSIYCGWAIEVEALRIPSTSNWAIVSKCCSSCHSILLREELSELFVVWVGNVSAHRRRQVTMSKSLSRACVNGDSSRPVAPREKQATIDTLEKLFMLQYNKNCRLQMVVCC
jgi:hypothetical protein